MAYAVIQDLVQAGYEIHGEFICYNGIWFQYNYYNQSGFRVDELEDDDVLPNGMWEFVEDTWNHFRR